MDDKSLNNNLDPVLVALDEAINSGPWDKSNFLKVIGKNLREIRDKYAGQLSSEHENEAQITRHSQISQKKDYQEIFIALYSSDGNNLFSWERILTNLPKQIISRPIYSNESDVVELLRSKENKLNEAYVSVLISQNDILQTTSDKTLVDKLGKPLISLKNKSINLENIKSFVHQSGTYTYLHGRLIKKPSSE